MTSLMKLNKNQLKEMADIMSDAFLFHSNFVYLIPNQRRRKKALNSLFYMMYKVINVEGFIFAVHKDNEVVGYITFMDDNKTSISFINVLKTNGIHNFLMFLLNAGLKSLSKFNKYMSVYNQYDHRVENSIHLYSTGIKKEYRGKGIMKPAFIDSFNYFKELGYKKIILETSDANNNVIYDKMGFKEIKVIESKDGQKIYFFEKVVDGE